MNNLKFYRIIVYIYKIKILFGGSGAAYAVFRFESTGKSR